MQTKLPSFQFYPGDWRKDPGVQSLTYHNRGVWFEMLCLMHESEERGVLTLNGKAMSTEALSCLLGLLKQNLTIALTTIEEHGVCSRRETDGAIICRRMVRDEKLRQTRIAAGKLGGNPILLKQKSTTGVKQKPTPSSSPSISVSSSDIKTKKPHTPKAKTPITYTPEFTQWWLSYPSRPGQPRGNKKEAAIAFESLDRSQRLQVAQATKALIAAVHNDGKYPKDAQRFIRVGKSGGDMPYVEWLDIAPARTKRLNDVNTLDDGDCPLERAKEIQAEKRRRQCPK